MPVLLWLLGVPFVVILALDVPHPLERGVGLLMRLIQQRVRPQVRTFDRESFLRSTEVVPGWFVSRNGAESYPPQFVRLPAH